MTVARVPKDICYPVIKSQNLKPLPPPQPPQPQPQGSQSNARGGPFAVLNGAAARDVLVVSVPANTAVEAPLYVLCISTSGADASHRDASAPRLLVHAGEGAEVEVLEEYVGAAAGGNYFNCSIAEFFLEERAHVSAARA